MAKSCLVAIAAVGLVLALGAAANAGGRGPGGGGSSTPPGFGSPGGHGGFETYTHTGSTGTITTGRLPGGWDEGKAGWKSGLQGTNPNLNTRPPGLGRH